MPIANSQAQSQIWLKQTRGIQNKHFPTKHVTEATELTEHPIFSNICMIIETNDRVDNGHNF